MYLRHFLNPKSRLLIHVSHLDILSPNHMIVIELRENYIKLDVLVRLD